MKTSLRAATRLILPTLFGIALGSGLFGGGLAAPSIGLAAGEVAGPPRRPPMMPPAVPLGAPEHLAFFTYVEKINQAWGHDWPTVIRLFEEFDARYPNNWVVRDKLYAAYLEDAKRLTRAGDLRAARGRGQQAVDWDPGRPEAHDLLDEIEQLARTAGGR